MSIFGKMTLILLRNKHERDYWFRVKVLYLNYSLLSIFTAFIANIWENSRADQ